MNRETETDNERYLRLGRDLQSRLAARKWP